ncbi:hypothetical protein SEMRO_392_G133321.1 [Seminavis robusta]|uniref:Uncharacterized protein n=1 Tax=Seminavis robusta TaxID=568900 RepID=A0A9N8HC52_9STRA|nr:hypothetical protein SEMRO_392_G133321.1 [Seminavis robusta]|eukprot:Sro392_g133321.1  (151) ;mRNA; r:19029-19481
MTKLIMTQYSKHVEICVEITRIIKENNKKIDHDERHDQLHHGKHTDTLYNKKITTINAYEPNGILELMLPSPQSEKPTKMTLLPSNTHSGNNLRSTEIPTMELLPLILSMHSQMWQQPGWSRNSHIGVFMGKQSDKTLDQNGSQLLHQQH